MARGKKSRKTVQAEMLRQKQREIERERLRRTSVTTLNSTKLPVIEVLHATVNSLSCTHEVRALVRENKGIEYLSVEHLQLIFAMFAGPMNSPLPSRVFRLKEVETMMEALLPAQWLAVMRNSRKIAQELIDFWKDQAHLSGNANLKRQAAEFMLALLDTQGLHRVSLEDFLTNFPNAFHSYVLAASAGRCVRSFQFQPPRCPWKDRTDPRAWVGVEPCIQLAGPGPNTTTHNHDNNENNNNTIGTVSSGLWTIVPLVWTEGGGPVLKLQNLSYPDASFLFGSSLSESPAFCFLGHSLSSATNAKESMHAFGLGVKTFCVAPSKDQKNSSSSSSNNLNSTIGNGNGNGNGSGTSNGNGSLITCLVTPWSLILCTNDRAMLGHQYDAQFLATHLENGGNTLEVLAEITIIPPVDSSEPMMDVMNTRHPSLVAAQFSSDANYLISLTDEENDDDWAVRVWSVTTQEVVMAVARKHTAFPTGPGPTAEHVNSYGVALALMGDDSGVFIGERDGTVHFYRLGLKNKQRGRRDEDDLVFFAKLIHTFTMTDDPTALFAGDSTTSPITSPRSSGTGLMITATPQVKRFPASALAVSGDSKLLISNGGFFDQPSLAVWSILDGTLLRLLPCGSDRVHSIAVAEDNLHLVSAGRRVMKVWNHRAPSPLLKTVAMSSTGGNAGCRAMGFCPSGEIFTIGVPLGCVDYWQIKTWNARGCFFSELKIRHFLCLHLVLDVARVVVDYLR